MSFDLDIPDIVDEFYLTQDNKTSDPDYEPPPETEEVINVDENSTTAAKEMRAVASNLESLDADNFILSNKSPNTLKQDQYVQKLYMDTMRTVQRNKNLPMVPELQNTSKEDLVINLERFFMVCVKQNGELYNAASYEQFYCVIARILSQRKTNPVDLKNDVMFRRLRDIVKARKEAAAKSGNVPGMWASQAVPYELIEEAFRKNKFGRDTPRSLVTFTNYIMMVGFGTRAAQVLNKGIVMV